MPRAKQLSEYELGLIDGLVSSGLSNRKIAKQINRSPRQGLLTTI
jgi:IS30 family transposase